ncbi:MAG: plasmid recombination protein [Eubacterium sp.]|nr:plasmid recombination protein [Eubacterium sp.]
MERTISFMNGEGSIGHNTRRFIADNVDASRTKDNITLINEDIKQVYHKLFDKALDEYNAKQKRKDRQIKNYYEKIKRSKQEKLFYEVIVQIGNMDDTGVGSYSAEIATQILKDYVELFQFRNPQLYVFEAYIHMDEETPHLHLDFVPWVSGSERGLETKTSFKGALAGRGFASEGKGNTEWQQWSETEKEDIASIMEQYGIGWHKKGTHNKHLSVLDYKKQERAKEVAALEAELEDVQVVLDLKEERVETLAENRELEIEGEILQMKNSRLQTEYYEVADKLTDKKNEIEIAEKEADKWRKVASVAKTETEYAQFELAEAERLKNELLGGVDGDSYLKEQVIELRYQNHMLREENKTLRDKVEKAYEFMKQFVIGGMTLLEKFMEWISENVRNVGRGR